MSNNRRSTPRHAGVPAAQRGVVLVIALIFLLLLTILAVGASNRSLLQERMAGGLLSAQRAQMSAQTALRGAEWKVWSGFSLTAPFVCVASAGCYRYSASYPNTDAVNFRTKPGWVTTGSAEYTGLQGSIDFTATVNGKLAENPRYIIEDMGVVRPGSGGESGATGMFTRTQPNYELYRITARATGGDKNTVVVLQSTVETQTH